LLLPDRPALRWVVPVTDGVNIVCFAVIAALGALDARLRADSASLPAAAIGVALSVLWLAHLLTFPGILPALTGRAVADDTTGWIFLLVNTATPTMLALAALHVPRPLADGTRGARLALGLGLALGAGVAGLALLLALSPLQVVHDDAFGRTSDVAGAFGLVPVAAAGVLLVMGHRGDERVLRGIVPALALSGVNSLLLIWLTARYTTIWYATHVLPTAIAITLLFGQLNLYARSIRGELRAIGRLQASFRTAEAVASSLQPEVVVDRLLEQCMAVVEADRAMLCRVEGDSIVVEGYRSVDTPPLTPGERYPLSSAPVIRAAVLQRRSQAAVGPLPTRLRNAAGGRWPANSRHALAVPLMYAHEIVGVLGLARVRDVPFEPDDLATVGTMATVAAVALRNARQFAGVEEVSRAKSLFLNMAAHELRTPLSVVRGYASMLRDGTLGDLPGQSKGAVTALQSKSDELAHLVEGLLMASRLEAGRAQARRQEVDARAAVRAAVDRLRPSAELRSARIDVALPPGAVWVCADSDYVGRILDNLLVNAITYSYTGPWLRISVEAAAGGRARTAVEDHGVGLRPEDHERIFERFERVEHPELGFPAGTGLGLYLSRRLAGAMGGSVTLERSSPGRGSRFVLELPLILGPEASPGPAAAQPAAPSQTKAPPEEPATGRVRSWVARSDAPTDGAL
ncbi:MAG TPA: GAF domain-containing sensor histidine kinase, partial [Candidatus Dormibacteraeota bacterium]|nr:GAF domain-containing sensor histidine kinase [Candidatus Dormibacteraeota bacterium]